jgi:hypothetical protein
MATKGRNDNGMSDNQMLNMINKKLNVTSDAYKCSALRSWSNPVPLSLEFGRRPVKLLLARSSHVTFESLPNEGGMLPVNWFEFRAL